jgi:hypothetical protein
MEGAERRGFLLAIVENAFKGHKIWAEGGDTHLLPEDNLYQRFAEISEQARFVSRAHATDLERLILEFSGQWRAFVSAQQQNMDVGMLPGDNLWSAWEALDAERFAAAMPDLKDIEPIEQLVSQKVSDRQICLIYGFFRADGSPDFRKLREEKNTPGKHTGEGWVAPVNQKIVEQIRMAEIDRDSIRRRRAAKVAAANTPAPESIEMLVSEGVSAEQISKMKKISTGDVLRYCEEHNLPMPAINYDATLKGPKPYDPDKSDARQRIESAMENHGPQPGGPVGDGPAIEVADGVEDLPIEEQAQIMEAVGYAEQGMTPPQIAQHMRIKADAVRDLLRKGGYEAVANS